MVISKFKEMLAVPTKTYHEERMVAYLAGYILGLGVDVYVDGANNIYVIKGDNGQPLPCVAAHIDSVQPLRPVCINEPTPGIITACTAQGKQCGFGADDKAGIKVCLDLLERFDHIAVVLFAAEEWGCHGAYWADPGFFAKLGYLIEFDCPGRHLVSYTSGGERLFENGGEFITKAMPALMKHGSTQWQHHPYSDVMAIRGRFPLSCLNLSCGYYNWHAPNEYIKLDDVEAAVEQGAELIQTLGNNHYYCPRILDDEPPAIEVGHLRMLKV